MHSRFNTKNNFKFCRKFQVKGGGILVILNLVHIEQQVKVEYKSLTLFLHSVS